MSSLPRSIRRNALAKIAELSATSSNGNFEGSDIERLCRVSPGNNKLYGRVNGINNDSPGSLAGSPMNIREFEVLLALCKAAPLIDNTYSAEKLTSQLSPYVLEAHTQLFVQSPLFRAIEPSPVEALSYNLTTALLSIDNCVHASEIATENRGVSSEYATEIEEAIHVATVTISLLGFLDAVASLVNFWSAKERLDLCERVKAILSEGFLVAVETAFSTIRNTHLQSSHVKEWKRYVRHYAAIGRPLGAMLLQRSFMWLLVAGSSLLLVDVENLKDKDVLSVLMSHFEDLRPNTPRNEQVDPETVNTLANIASNEISLLEDGADYLRLGSAWQQRLAFSVKASALTTYMNCAMLSVTDDEVEPETLMSWLEDTLADPVQMADDTLANVVLRSMALVSKLSPQLAPEVSRLLPRFIVQGNPQGNTNTIASACLAYVLNHLSQDAIITTLYTLGNVLNSGASHPEKHNSVPNGDLALDGAAQSNLYGKNSNGSSISLEIFTEEDTSTVYGNVVQAICAIAQDCQDPKIIALAQSMLLQKIDKINQLIDARIITAAAELSLCGGPLEFRSLLKLYGKITHLGVMKTMKLYFML
ncbi:phosphatidylinositol 3 [Botrytis cinerea]